MLKALYDYAQRNSLTIPDGYVKKTVKAYILLSKSGEFRDIQAFDSKAPDTVLAPDIGSLANGKDKSNVLVEKRSVVIPDESSSKSQFFLNALKDGGEIEPLLKVCADALEHTETSQAIRKALDEKKVKTSDRISFKVRTEEGYVSILDNKETKTLEWWQNFRKKFTKKPTGGTVPCLITGEQTVPVATTTPINGLHSVGGHARGDALICFDKNAFCSYGLKKAENAPVSEASFSAVKSALDKLLETAPTLSGMKFVHWYDFDLSGEKDIIDEVFSPEDEEIMFSLYSDDDDDEEEAQSEAERLAEEKAHAQAAEGAANELVKSVKTGKQAFIPENASYYILMLTGVGGRIMIRRYERGSYRDLQRNLQLWREDLALVNRNGINPISSCKLSKRLIVLLNYQQIDRNVFDRMAKELSGISPAVVTSILSGGVLPESVPVRALSYIRSKMLSSEENAVKDLFTKDVCVWQWLKVWLLRNREKRGKLMKEYNPTYDSNAYHCGAMMAVYEALQNTAMPDVNASVMQRFYCSAMQTPKLVLGRLSKMSVFHLEMMKEDKKGLRTYYSRLLNETSSRIHGDFPTVLTLEEQTEFALGYYQMRAELFRKKENDTTDKED